MPPKCRECGEWKTSCICSEKEEKVKDEYRFDERENLIFCTRNGERFIFCRMNEANPDWVQDGYKLVSVLNAD